METGRNLEDLKADYKKLEKKHGLPSFEKLNEYFSIDKISDNETDFLLREIRRVIGDRLMGYMRFIENLINPANVPMFIFSIVKAIEQDKKQILMEIYKLLIKNEVKFIKLDLEYSEGAEAEYIKDSVEIWDKTRKDFFKILEQAEKNLDNKAEKNKKDYFG